VGRLKLALAAAVKAKRAWDRLPPEQRAKLLQAARKEGPVVARKAADVARTRAPVVARRLAEAVEKARRAPGE
jgi:TRAP-type C4-dicarboxylate transport system substrate-binding protein